VFVVADVDPDWLHAHIRAGELSEAFTPPFLGALASQLGRRVNAIDLLALASAGGAPPEVGLTPVTDLEALLVAR
jgi:hypothetical protein